MSLTADHSRTIIHIDLDCFYAQVEIIKNPELVHHPVGIKQKNIVVTSNYVARKFGIKKCMMIEDAYRVCPSLVLVNGEDLHDYRNISYQVTNYMQQFSPLVERLGLDENYVDVTELVRKRRLEEGQTPEQVTGNLFGGDGDLCDCSCKENLIVGSQIAQEIRDGLYEKLKLTSCAGIAHNKLLAKLVGAKHKPNQQTTLFPNGALELMLSLDNLQCIPGIGCAACEQLKNIGIVDVRDVHDNFSKLEMTLGVEKANWITSLSYGRDTSPVKSTGRPQSIGIEDSCKLLRVEVEVMEKFRQLLKRLMILVSEDGRVPTTLKITIRKCDNSNKTSHRETRQCNINPKLFISDTNTKRLILNEQSENKLLSIIMHLFNRVADLSNSCNITLLGVSFTKFKERVSGKNSIASYFVKDVSVQSLTNISHNRAAPRKENNVKTHRETSIESPDSDAEPLPKKSKIYATLSKSRDSSPSRLSIAGLRLNAHDTNKRCDHIGKIDCPPSADKSVFEALPFELQKELWDEWQNPKEPEHEVVKKRMRIDKPNTLLNYFCKQ